jgi:1-acyl-sn-glycerol-3-phosphate acyltransferase
VNIWRRIARAILRAVLGLLFHIRLEGAVPASGPYLLIANHQGWADAFLLIALLPAEPRIHFIADRAATMTVWWKRTLLRSLGVVVPVARDGSSERGAIAATLRLLEQRDVVAIFPEGRVARTEHSDVAPFARGVGYLALKAGVPIVPVWLRGTAELYVGRELTVRVGDLVPAPMGPLSKEATQQVAAYLHDTLARLALPWSEPIGPRRLRWLTHLF